MEVIDVWQFASVFGASSQRVTINVFIVDGISRRLSVWQLTSLFLMKVVDAWQLTSLFLM